MRNKIKIIDLLCLISNGEAKPQKIKYKGHIWFADTKTYYDENYDDFFVMIFRYNETHSINDEVEILDEEDKDIPLIPDDELYNLKNNVGLLPGVANEIDFNFKVLQEKINEVVKEFNEYRKDKE